MLEELCTDSELSTDRHETRPEAEPGHVPGDEGIRLAEWILELPAGMDKVHRARCSRWKGSC